MTNRESFIPPAESQRGWFKVEFIDAEVGVGVVACRDIAAGTPLNLFPLGFGSRTIDAAQANEFHKSHGIAREDSEHGLYFVIPHFDEPIDDPNSDPRAEPGWFLNHRAESPNGLWDPTVEDGLVVAGAKILTGEQVEVDYALLREPATHVQRPESAWYRREIGPGPQYDPAIILPEEQW